MDNIDFFSTETITVPIGFRFVRDCLIVSIVNNRKNIQLSGTGALEVDDNYVYWEIGL